MFVPEALNATGKIVLGTFAEVQGSVERKHAVMLANTGPVVLLLLELDSSSTWFLRGVTVPQYPHGPVPSSDATPLVPMHDAHALHVLSVPVGNPPWQKCVFACPAERTTHE